MKRLLCLTMGLFLVFSLGFGDTLIDAQEPDPPTRPPPRPPLPLEGSLDKGLWADLPREVVPSDPDVQDSASMYDLARSSKLIFQSMRDGNWEVYIANGDGSSQTRLAQSNSSDIHPRLNRGCTRIVFASNRKDKQYDLYAMNLDGTGIVRLTNNAKDDVRPVWSPDGTRIAFQSYRNGQAEVYVMNADGSGQTRLTSHPDFDASPTWSPDGAQIAFVSRRTGGYRIWAMNADGSGQRQLSDQPYSENPAWSPDGKHIAYDANGDGDGWQELWMMNADGANQGQVFGLGGNRDVFVSGWSPDGVRVAYTRAQWYKYKSKWYLIETVLRHWSSGGEAGFQEPSTKDMYADWQTMDTQSPGAFLGALPAMAHSGVTIRWSGHDRGPAGIRSYDVQVRQLPGSDWTDWKMDTRDTSAPFENRAGVRYQFRVRARDHAHNVSPWSAAGGDDAVTLYTWSIKGTARDVRGIPLAGVVAQIRPQGFRSLPSDREGAYQTFVAGEAGSYGVAWPKTGYVGLPETQLNGSQDQEFDVVLPAGDNLVRNGGFEAASSALDHWQAGGVLTPTVRAEARHTGRYGVRMGARPSTAVNVSSTEDASFGPQMVTEQDGTVHVVWLDIADTLRRRLYYARKSSAGQWSAPELVADGFGGGHQQLAVDDTGVAHVVYMAHIGGSRTLRSLYTRRSTNGAWSNAENASRTGGPSELPLLAVDSGGAVHLTWLDSTTSTAGDTVYYGRRAPDGTWSDALNLSNSSDESSFTRMALDAGGALHVVWAETSGSPHSIQYARRGSDGSWSGTQQISTLGGGHGTPQIAVDQSDAVWVVWSDTKEIYASQRGANGAWSPRRNLSNSTNWSFRPQLAVSPGPRIHVAWQEDASQDDQIRVARRAPDGTWSGPQALYSASEITSINLAADGNSGVHLAWNAKIERKGHAYYGWQAFGGTPIPQQDLSSDSEYAGDQQLAVDGQNDAHVTWGGETALERDIYYTVPQRITQIGDARLSQAVTLPAEMNHPTLSFLYQLETVDPDSPYSLNVQIAGESSEDMLFSATNRTDGWVHRWFDLAAWSGETVTLTFTVQQAPDHAHAWAFLDEVSIASIYPDLWVSKQARPRAARPGEQVVYGIAYGNRGSVAAQGVRISDTLPAGFAYVGAHPAPDKVGPALVWDVGDLPAVDGQATIVLTATIPSSAAGFETYSNTVVIQGSSPELETWNNQAQSATWIGRRSYLPLLMNPE